jgi:hypothetical protein
MRMRLCFSQSLSESGSAATAGWSQSGRGVTVMHEDWRDP